MRWVPLSAEHDFAELITTVALDKDALKEARRNVEEGAELILEKAKSTGTMEIEISAAAGPKPPKPRRG
eukprot:7486964-Pyramimonas_sp.AAC.1